MIQLTDNQIDFGAVVERVRSPSAGAVVLFLGTAREWTGGRQTESLEYEAYVPMAERKLAEVAEEAKQRWNLTGLAVVHRIGHLEIGEVSVAVAASSAHRQDAFAACQYLIDRIKQVVPIWKCENWADGTREWVHPGLDQDGGSGSGKAGEVHGATDGRRSGE
jgi:molybdopterin synthase catalytic subunit